MSVYERIQSGRIEDSVHLIGQEPTLSLALLLTDICILAILYLSSVPLGPGDLLRLPSMDAY